MNIPTFFESFDVCCTSQIGFFDANLYICVSSKGCFHDTRRLVKLFSSNRVTPPFCKGYIKRILNIISSLLENLCYVVRIE